jgi:hypothetical protein
VAPPPCARAHTRRRRCWQVFHIPATGEVFRAYPDFLRVASRYAERVWACAHTGKGGLTYAQAADAERAARAALEKFPAEHVAAVARAVHHSTRRVDELVSAIYDALRPKDAAAGGGAAAPAPAAAPAAADGGSAAAAPADDSPTGVKENGAAAGADGKKKARGPKAPVAKPLLRAWIVEHAAPAPAPEHATKRAWAVRPELAARLGLPAALPPALAAELAASVKPPAAKKRPAGGAAAEGGAPKRRAKGEGAPPKKPATEEEKAAAKAARHEAKAAAKAAAGEAKKAARAEERAAKKAAAVAARPAEPAKEPKEDGRPPAVRVEAKPLAEVEAQYGAGTLRAAVVAALKAAPAGGGLTAQGVMDLAAARGIRAFEPKHKVQVAQALAGDANFVRLEKGVYALHALHPGRENLWRPPAPKPAAERPAAEAEPAEEEGGDPVERAERALARARGALERRRGALERAEAAAAAARAAFASARKGAGAGASPDRAAAAAAAAAARRASDAPAPPEALARFELAPAEREFGGDADDRKGLLEFRQRLQARAKELERAKKEFLEGERARREAAAEAARAAARSATRAEEGALKAADKALAAARRRAESAEKAVAAGEKRLEKERRRAGLGGAKEARAAEREARERARAEGRERRRAEAEAARRYPMDDADLARELAEAAVAAGAPLPPADVAPPTAWLPPPASARLSAALFVADFFSQFARTLGLRGAGALALADLDAALAGAPGGAGGGAAAAASAPVHAAYRRVLAFVLADLRAQGAATAAERRWGSLLSEGTWPEVLRRLVAARARSELPCERPDAPTAAAAAALAAPGGADALAPEAHLALLRFLADEALDSGAMHDALQRREDDAAGAARDAKGDMAEERRRLRELADAEKEERRRRREAAAAAEAAREAAAAEAAGDAAAASAAAASAAAEEEPDFELAPEFVVFSGPEDDRKAQLVWRQAAQAEKRRLERARAEWEAGRAARAKAAAAAAKDAAAAERAKVRERDAAREALAAAEEELEARLERLAVRRAPLGADRHGRRYWWGLAGHREALLVEEGVADGEGVARSAAAVEPRWGEYATVEAAAALLASLERRGVREVALAGALEKRWEGIEGALARGAARAEKEREREGRAAERAAEAEGREGRAAERGEREEREAREARERAGPTRASARAAKQVELFDPCPEAERAPAPRATRGGAAAGADGGRAAGRRPGSWKLEPFFGPSEVAAVEAAVESALEAATAADGAGVAPPEGAAGWRAWGRGVEAASAGDVPPGAAGAPVTADDVRAALRARLLELEGALLAVGEAPLEPSSGDEADEEEGDAVDAAGEGSDGSGSGEEEEEVLEEDFSPSKPARDPRRLWRTARERGAWAADVRAAATCARLAYSAAVLGQQAAPLLRAARRARGPAFASPAPAAAAVSRRRAKSVDPAEAKAHAQAVDREERLAARERLDAAARKRRDAPELDAGGRSTRARG